MPNTPSADAPKGLRLRTSVWRRHCARLGATTLPAKAALLSPGVVDVQSLSRFENGTRLVTVKFFVAVLDLFPDSTLDELFDRVYDDALVASG